MTPDQPATLRDVARAALDAHPGTSGRELERMARKQGLTISYTTINHLAAGTYNSRPSTKTLDALVELSGYSRQAVYTAAQQPLPQAPFAEQLPPDVDLLTPTQRESVLTIIRQFIQSNRELFGRDVVDFPSAASELARLSLPDETVARQAARRAGLTQAEREEAIAEGRRQRPPRKGEMSPAEDETA